MKISYFFALFFFCFSFQIKAAGQALEIGQKVPPVVLKGVLNDSRTEINLDTLKGKYVILDFWAFGCSACIAAFPKIDSLQQAFGNQLQIIAVNNESKEATQAFLDRLKKIKLPAIPFVTGDSILSSWFPFKFVPHHVWINPAGKVQYISNGFNTTAKHIQQVLAGKDIALARKKDVFQFDYTVPLIAEGNGRWLDKVEYYSYITRMIPGVKLFNPITPNSISRYGSVLDLIKTAFIEDSKYDFSASNTIQLLVNDTAAFIYPVDRTKLEAWSKQHIYYYDLKVPDVLAHQKFKMMQEDIMRYFNLSIHVEQQKVKSLVLMRTSKKDKLAGKGGENVQLHRGVPVDSLMMFRDWTMKDIVESFNDYFMRRSNATFATPFIDHTGYEGKVDIGINLEAMIQKDISRIRKELQQYDLDLVERKWKTNVLVIREKESSQLKVK